MPWWQQWPWQGLHTYPYGCHISPQSTPAQGCDLAGIYHGPSNGRCSLSACQHCSSHRFLARVLGKHFPGWRKQTLWGNIFTFSSLWRTVVSRWPSPTAHPFSPECSPPCLHPSRDSSLFSSGHLLPLSILAAPRSRLGTRHTEKHLADAQQPGFGVHGHPYKVAHPCSPGGLFYGPAGLAGDQLTLDRVCCSA